MEYDDTYIYDIKEYDHIRYFTGGIYYPLSYIPDDYKERVFLNRRPANPNNSN